MRKKDRLFEEYSIIQDDDFFKLGQDTTILSYFLKIGKNQRALDIGAGCGALSLLSLIRNCGCHIDGIELSSEAANICNENLELNGFSQRASCACMDFKKLDKSLYGKYDVCMSNPPYYSLSQGKLHQKPIIAAARSESTGNIFDVCLAAEKALKWGGRFYVCYKPERMAALMAALARANFQPKNMRFVYQKPQGNAILVLVEAKKGGGEGIKIAPPLMICDELGQKTHEYLYIYGGK